MAHCIPRNVISWKIVCYFLASAVFIIVMTIIVDRGELDSSIEMEISQVELLQMRQYTYLPETNLSDFQITKRFPKVIEFALNPKIRFGNEETRFVGFTDRTPSHTSSRKVIYLATPYFGEWNAKHYYALHLGDTTFRRYSCPTSECYVTKDSTKVLKADAVLFHLRDLEVYSLPKRRTPEQVWILYSMEPPWLEIQDLRKFKGIFNWTMSYRRGSDVLMRYGFIGRKPSNSKVLWKRQKAGLDDDRAAWLVSNCRTDGNREGYVERLRKVFPVDVYGGCGKESCRPAETHKCYARLEFRYKFYLAFENAVCRDYVTEKLFNALEYDMVPVVFGGANYSHIVPEGSVINAMDFRSPEHLGRYLWKVSKNDTLYRSFFTWKQHYRSYIQPWMCDLCSKLHEKRPVSKQLDLEEWWNEGNSCKRWMNESFEIPKESVFPVYNVTLFM
ncbi:hypothetical protein JTE90_006405 [Oedothorax gibbosus]|uniref:Fucosyltransferase n=1 Tax=Oedothorax gibbosus TaxID=931172 RepID=A0AAV6VXK9_9ARAC|nr:hypothetical protein JTE90_006405 [Oedothorax gibbosus]